MLSHYRNFSLLGFAAVLSCFVASCSDSKIVQCQKIAQISQKISQQAQSSRHSQDPQKIEETAQRFADSAKELDNLNLSDTTLADYKKELSTVYQRYWQSTILMLKALENKDIKTARLAKQQVIDTSKNEKTVGEQIGQYCQGSG